MPPSCKNFPVPVLLTLDGKCEKFLVTVFFVGNKNHTFNFIVTDAVDRHGKFSKAALDRCNGPDGIKVLESYLDVSSGMGLFANLKGVWEINPTPPFRFKGQSNPSFISGGCKNPMSKDLHTVLSAGLYESS